jgi:choline dehydrogenase-like flavoprotein
MRSSGWRPPSFSTCDEAAMATTDPASSYDIIIIGSGMGGGTLAYALRESGARILVLERGDFIPRERENWDTDAIFVQGRYRANDTWQDAEGRSYQPGLTYAVGGNTRVYGASLPRFRRSDFGAVEHADGVSPSWPFEYDDLAPHYTAAEQLFGVHGEVEQGQHRAGPFPYPPIEHEPQVQAIANRLAAAGYTPSHLPLGLDRRPGGRCIRCATCDGYVCLVDAKADADVRCIRPALATGNVEILTRAYARRILTDPEGRRATGVEIEHDGRVSTIAADLVVASCGAVNSAALLLRSGNDRHPNGLANSSGAVGRHYMVHNNSIMVAARPFQRNTTIYQKTLYVNDFYDRGTDDHPYPLGHIQLIGKVREQMVRPHARWAPRWARRYLTDRSMDWWLFSEDLPDPENRVELTTSGAVRLHWKPNNVRAHDLLVREAKRMARAAGYPITLTRRAGIEVCSHQAGTVRAGDDPATSVLDPSCRAHDVENLYVVDGSFFPSLPLMNPALTIASNALRVSGHIMGKSVVEAQRAHGGVIQ